MNFLTRFSNSWGHLVMSLALIAAGLILILATSDATLHGIGLSCILTAQGYWFASSVAAHNGPPSPPQNP